MFSRLKRWLDTQYFDESFSLEYRICMIFFLESFLIVLVATVTNMIVYPDLFGDIFQWSYVVVCAIFLFSPPQARQRFLKPQLLFLGYIYLPFLFFHTAGNDGSALLFAVLVAFIMAVVFSGRQRIAVITLDIVITVACILAHYLFPEAIRPNPSMEHKVFDLAFTVALAIVGLSIITAYITNAFAAKNKELEQLTYVDPLTGAYNRRFLTDFLLRELNSCCETGRTDCLLMFDLDLFKRINDTYGHGFGDDVLRKFHHAVQHVLREYDVFARYGGEEFVAVLPDVKLADAMDIAERARKAVSACTFRNSAQITVSIGVTSSYPDDTLDSILRRADDALYRAKSNGRDCVFCDRQFARSM